MLAERPGEIEVDIGAKLAFLRQPGAYPELPAQVSAVETHMSWVFLTERHAYKLKKPVRWEFLDFSTIEARRRDCEVEVRLNRCLAADVYLGVVPLTMEGGRLALDGRGPVADWLVKMRRLPRERMLDRLIARGGVRPADLQPMIVLLAHFYAAGTIRDDAEVFLRRLRLNAEANAAELAVPAHRLPAERVAAILAAQTALLEREPELFRRRVRDGRIVEGHGDLRPEHVCLETVPVIIDCLEFNRDFRILDCADDLAFLALECERLGSMELADAIFDLYGQASGDRPPQKLVDFYKSCRACLRAKLALWHLRDGEAPAADGWVALAREYLALAEKYAARLAGPRPPAAC